MSSFKTDFCDFKGSIWLNAASEGPLAKCAATALDQAVEWKRRPYLLTLEKFASTPKELKKSIGRLINVDCRDVILGNSASYGLHLLSDGITFKKQDEILLMQNDFPTNILPWLIHKKNGVKVKQIKPKNGILSVNELRDNITKRTKLLCISHVHTFTGLVIDLEEISKACKDNNIIFILNISQSAGTREIDISKFPIDAVVCAGYKWLCGPYGTGFCWIKPSLRKTMKNNRAYWTSALTQSQIDSTGRINLSEDNSAKKFDQFACANFFNFVPFKVSLDYFLNIGMQKVSNYQQDLIDGFIEELDFEKYFLISHKERISRSSLCVFSHKQIEKNLQIHRALLANKIYTAFWKGNIRISPHIYNSLTEIKKLASVLNRI